MLSPEPLARTCLCSLFQLRDSTASVWLPGTVCRLRALFKITQNTKKKKSTTHRSETSYATKEQDTAGGGKKEVCGVEKGGLAL